MIEDWQDKISNLLQVPFCYCIHDKDLCSDGTLRKTHVHIMIVWGNTTTYKSALTCFKKLEKDGCCAIPNDKIEVVQNVRFMYNYLIHDTEDCRKKNKHLYKSFERISGNGFDIGAFEQLSLIDTEKMLDELERLLIENSFTNFGAFYRFVKFNADLDKEYSVICRKNHGFLEALCRGFYLEEKKQREDNYYSGHTTTKK